jgi:hypothetical protein
MFLVLLIPLLGFDTAFATSDESLLNFSSIMSVVMDIAMLLYLKTTEINNLLIGTDFILGEEAYAAMRPMWVNARNIVNAMTLGYMAYLGIDNILRGIQGKKFGSHSLKQMVPKTMLGLVVANFTLLGMEVMIDTINLGYSAIVSVGVESWESQFPRNMIGNVLWDTTGQECFTESSTCKTMEKWFNSLYCPAVDGSGNSNTSSEDCWFQVKADQLHEATPGNIPNIFLPWMMLSSNVHSAPLLSELLSNVNGFARNTLYNTLFMVAFAMSSLYIMMALVLRVVFLWMFIVLSPFIMMDTIMDLGVFMNATGVKRKIVMFLLVPLKIAFTFTVGFVMIKHMAGFAPDFLDHTFVVPNAGIHGDKAFSYLWQVMTIALFWYTAIWCFDDRLSDQIINAVTSASKSASSSVANAYNSTDPSTQGGGNVTMNNPRLNGGRDSNFGDGSATGFSPIDNMIKGSNDMLGVLERGENRDINLKGAKGIGSVLSSLNSDVNSGLVDIPSSLQEIAKMTSDGNTVNADALGALVTKFDGMAPERPDVRNMSPEDRSAALRQYREQQVMMGNITRSLGTAEQGMRGLSELLDSGSITPGEHDERKESLLQQMRSEMLVMKERYKEVREYRIEKTTETSRQEIMKERPNTKNEELNTAVDALRRQQALTASKVNNSREVVKNVLTDTTKTVDQKKKVFEAEYGKLGRHVKALEKEEQKMTQVLTVIKDEIKALEEAQPRGRQQKQEREERLTQLRGQETYIENHVLNKSVKVRESVETDKRVTQQTMVQVNQAYRAVQQQEQRQNMIQERGTNSNKSTGSIEQNTGAVEALATSVNAMGQAVTVANAAMQPVLVEGQRTALEQINNSMQQTVNVTNVKPNVETDTVQQVNALVDASAGHMQQGMQAVGEIGQQNVQQTEQMREDVVAQLQAANENLEALRTEIANKQQEITVNAPDTGVQSAAFATLAAASETAGEQIAANTQAVNALEGVNVTEVKNAIETAGSESEVSLVQEGEAQPYQNITNTVQNTATTNSETVNATTTNTGTTNTNEVVANASRTQNMQVENIDMPPIQDIAVNVPEQKLDLNGLGDMGTEVASAMEQASLARYDMEVAQMGDVQASLASEKQEVLAGIDALSVVAGKIQSEYKSLQKSVNDMLGTVPAGGSLSPEQQQVYTAQSASADKLSNAYKTVTETQTAMTEMLETTTPAPASEVVVEAPEVEPQVVVAPDQETIHDAIVSTENQQAVVETVDDIQNEITSLQSEIAAVGEKLNDVSLSDSPDVALVQQAADLQVRIENLEDQKAGLMAVQQSVDKGTVETGKAPRAFAQISEKNTKRLEQRLKKNGMKVRELVEVMAQDVA